MDLFGEERGIDFVRTFGRKPELIRVLGHGFLFESPVAVSEHRRLYSGVN